MCIFNPTYQQQVFSQILNNLEVNTLDKIRREIVTDEAYYDGIPHDYKKIFSR